MADMLEAAERLWHGGASTEVGQSHPVTHDLGLAEVADRTAFNAAFGNIAAFDTDEGLLLIDTGNEIFARSEEHTSELQSLMRISYAVFCLKKKKQKNRTTTNSQTNIQTTNKAIKIHM